MNSLKLKNVYIFLLGEDPAAVTTDTAQTQTQQPQAQMQVDENDLNPQVSQILESVRLDPSLRQDPEISKFLENYEKTKTADNAQNPPVANTATASNMPAAENKDVTKTEDDVDDDILDSSKVKSQKDKFESITPENLIEFAKEDGIDTTKPNWLSSLLKQYSSGKEAMDRAEKAQKVIDDYKSTLESLPTPLLLALKEFDKGGDWRVPLQVEDIDYSQDFDSLTVPQKVNIINKEFPNDKIEESDFDEKDPAIKKMSAIARKSFESKKQEISSMDQTNKEKELSKKQEFVSSINASAENFKKKYPNVDPDKLRVAQDIVANGIHKYYFNDDSKVNDRAVERAFFAEFGETMLESAKKKAKKDGSSEKAAELLSTTSSNGGTSNQQNQKQQSDYEKRLIEEDRRLSEMSKQTY